KVCENLLKYYCCTNYENCPYKHPKERVICVYQMEEGYCVNSECKYNHPNEITIDRIKGYMNKKLIKNEKKENNKMIIYYCLYDMKEGICPKYMMCDKLFCEY